MLIKCPECGKEISDKAPACIHCGYPLNCIDLNKVTENLYYKVVLRNCDTSKIKVLHFLVKAMNLSIKESKAIVENLPITIINNITEAKANEIKEVLESFKAVVTIEPADLDNDIKFTINEDVDITSFKQKDYSTKVDFNVQCPYCKSFNTSKISVGARVMDNAIWGLFSTKRNKQWKCKDCGSEF